MRRWQKSTAATWPTAATCSSYDEYDDTDWVSVACVATSKWPAVIARLTRVTTVLAEADDDPERMAKEPVAWVHVTEVLEGNWRALEHVVRFAEHVLTAAIG